MGKTLGTLLLVIFVAFIGKALFRAYWKYEATHGVAVSYETDSKQRYESGDTNSQRVEQWHRTDSKRGCENGDSEACRIMWRQCQNGSFEACENLMERLKQGCDSRVAIDCHNLGVMYEEGHGAEIDYKKAAEYYQKTCNMGEGSGCLSYGNIYQFGRGVKVNYSKAREYYEKACN